MRRLGGLCLIGVVDDGLKVADDLALGEKRLVVHVEDGEPVYEMISEAGMGRESICVQNWPRRTTTMCRDSELTCILQPR